ncbi:hypothetical protein [Lutibacter sp.]|uniref:hypothetical protein n=1 Tax=Lutibacter sp. TaxID=1925666 RepID=UPI00273389E7|nr:hypothetical protein [Lutibacter sp.]MDP3312471.1 hypothetical protein [Lutibacter sp.]
MKLEILIPIIIALYTGIAFLAHKKYEKFEKLSLPFIIILFIFIMSFFMWDMSALKYDSEIYKTLLDCDCKLNESFLENHSFGFTYYILFTITLIYILFLDYLFKPTDK